MSIRTLIIMQGGVLGLLDEAAIQLVENEISTVLDERRADHVFFSPLSADTKWARLLLKAFPPWRRAFALTTSKHWWIDITSAAGSLLARMKAKHRRPLKRCRRDLAQLYNGSLTLRAYGNPEDVDGLLADAELVAGRTYQRGLGVGISDTREFHERFSSAAKAGRLRAWILYGAQRPLAFLTGLVYGDIYHAEFIGYDVELSPYRPGILLLLEVTEELKKEGIARFDFGLGDALYKEQFGSAYDIEISFSVFSFSFSGCAAWGIRLTSELMNYILHTVLEMTGLANRVKRLWRARLRPLNDDKILRPHKQHLGGEG